MQIFRCKFARESPNIRHLLWRSQGSIREVQSPKVFVRCSISEAQCPWIFARDSTPEAKCSRLLDQGSKSYAQSTRIHVWAATSSTYYFYNSESNDSQVTWQTKTTRWSKTTTLQLQFNRRTFHYTFARESPCAKNCRGSMPRFDTYVSMPKRSRQRLYVYSCFASAALLEILCQRLARPKVSIARLFAKGYLIGWPSHYQCSKMSLFTRG